MAFFVALVLALDQRIELQLPLLLALSVVTVLRVPGTKWQPGRALLALILAAGYLAANSVLAFTDPAGLTESWWAAPVRIWLYYVLLIALATCLSARQLGSEAIYRTLEWLFLLKLAIIAVEGYFLFRTGEPRERPLFNIILSADSLLGARFTSSYDMLFALLALSGRRQQIRLGIVAIALVITETRALLLLSSLLLAWRLLRDQSLWSLLAAALMPVLGAVGVIAFLVADADKGGESRLTQIRGSSLDDKLEQIEDVGGRILSPYLLTGRGLGASLPGNVRDEARPYSYEAQTPVLLWQGGLMFYAVHLVILWQYGGRRRGFAIFLVLLLGMLNPTLFSLSSAFFIVAFGRVFDANHAAANTAYRRPGLHA